MCVCACMHVCMCACVHVLDVCMYACMQTCAMCILSSVCACLLIFLHAWQLERDALSPDANGGTRGPVGVRGVRRVHVVLAQSSYQRQTILGSIRDGGGVLVVGSKKPRRS